MSVYCHTLPDKYVIHRRTGLHAFRHRLFFIILRNELWLISHHKIAVFGVTLFHLYLPQTATHSCIYPAPFSHNSSLNIFIAGITFYGNFTAPLSRVKYVVGSNLLRVIYLNVIPQIAMNDHTFTFEECQTMHITNKRNIIQSTHTIHNHNLQSTNTAKYLGIHIDSTLKWNTHINKTAQRANTTSAFLNRNIRTCPRKIKHLAYTTLVRPILEYASII